MACFLKKGEKTMREDKIATIMKKKGDIIKKKELYDKLYAIFQNMESSVASVRMALRTSYIKEQGDYFIANRDSKVVDKTNS